MASLLFRYILNSTLILSTLYIVQPLSNSPFHQTFSKLSTMSKSSSSSITEMSVTSKSHNETVISRLKKHMESVQKKWGPLMAAKEDLDDEYNFPQGPYAGQGIPKRTRNW